MSDLGSRLREARKELGFTQSQISRHAHVSVPQISNVEAGRRTVTREILLAYVRVLGEDEMNRRGLLGTVVAAGVVAPIAADELLHAGFSAALRPRGAEDAWRSRVAGYGRDYMDLGAQTLQNRLAGDLVIVQQQLETPGMWESAARLLTTYGKTTGEPREAIKWYNLAIEAADRSNDLATRVWVRGRAAIALAYEGAATTVAIRYADEAILLNDKPSIGRLNALMARAHVAAGRGDLPAAIKADEEARRVFDKVASPDDEISDSAVPYWRLSTFESMLWARLGVVDRGERAQRDADMQRPENLTRFATHIELHRGLMMAHAGDKLGGLNYARAAMYRLPAERRSQTLRLVMKEVESAAKPGRQ
jgi:transcriptional regulator with XRE-family HTH domain